MMRASLALTTIVASVAADTCSNVNLADSDKIDCMKGISGDSQTCQARSCCWQQSSNSGTPWCFYSSPEYALASTTYDVQDAELKETSMGLEGILKVSSGTGSDVYGKDITSLKLEILYESDDYVRVKLTDANDSGRWQIPQSIIERPQPSKQNAQPKYSVKYTTSPFTFTVTRKEDGAVVFQSDKNLVYKDQYLQLSAKFNSGLKTYGLGESTRLNHALKSDHTYTMWNVDMAAANFNTNLYGSFPYYVQVDSSNGGAAHGAFLANSNGVDAILADDSLAFKAIGGVLDLYVFVGGSGGIPDVVNSYLKVVGRPAMVPYWSLGFHNCKYGYTNLHEVETVVANYASADIPLETQWMDIDYMDAYKDYTSSPTNFPIDQVKSFVDKLHANKQQFVQIIDPGIFPEDGYKAWDDGSKLDVFTKGLDGNNYLGQVWPGPAVFPDWLNPKTTGYWSDQITNYLDQVSLDGLWIDMNEVSNFCNEDGKGQVCHVPSDKKCPSGNIEDQTTCCLECSTVDANNKYDFPPYAIGTVYGTLGGKTMATSSVHFGNVTDYDVHNMYGLMEAKATNVALQKARGKRPFIITRSSFPSSGKHTGKWSGDNKSTWDDLKSSIISLFDFNMFGIPMIGSDICGFIDNTTEELCARWAELGSFYPFSRNHNALGSAPQEYYLWDSVAGAAKKALKMRYELMPYLYTLFASAAGAREQDANPMVARPLFVNFPGDEQAYGRDGQFMLGPGVMVTPVLEPSATSVSGYFPGGNWYDFKSRSLFLARSECSGPGTMETLQTPLTEINVHVHGGSILPLQDAGMTVDASRSTPFTLLVTTCPMGKGKGGLFYDDGEQISLDKLLETSYSAQISLTGGSVSGTVLQNTLSSDSDSLPPLSTIVVLGTPTTLATAVSKATLNGEPISSSQIEVKAADNSITFTGLSLGLDKKFSLEFA
jgi:alpha-glucosidase (family GH31 glycosyl hydrolase)